MPSPGGGPQTLPVSRSAQVADRLFTGTSQRRLNTQNLQEDLRMERYATSIERAKQATEHDHAFQRKTFIQKSEHLNEVKEQLKLRSVREQEAAREAEQLAQLNREQLVELMQRLAATQQEEVIVEENPTAGMPPARGATTKEGAALTKPSSVFPEWKISGSKAGAPMPRRRTSKDTEQSFADSFAGSQSSWRPSWDPEEEPEEGVGVPTVAKNRSRKSSMLGRPSASSLVHPTSSLEQSPRRKSSTGSSVHSTPRRVSDSRVALSRPPLSRRISAASFASSATASSSVVAPGRSEGKRSRSTGDAPDISAMGGLSRRSSQQQLGGLSRRASQQQLDIGDLKRLTRRLSKVNTDYLTDPSLMVEEERKVFEFLQKTQPTGGEDASQKHTKDSDYFQRKAKPRMSVVYTETAEKQLAQIFGSSIVEDLQSNNDGATAANKSGAESSDGFLQRLYQIPNSLPAVYLTHTRSSMVRPRNFSKEIEKRKAALPVHNQFENLRYCRYLRIPMEHEKDEEAEEEAVDNSEEGRLRRRATRMVPRTVNAPSNKRLTTTYSMTSELANKVQEEVGTTMRDAAGPGTTSPTAPPSNNLGNDEND